MNDSRDERLSRIVRSVIEPIGKRELQRDLWNQVVHKLPKPAISVSVFDWGLAALAVILSLLAPEAFLGLLANL
jgi:hypothetical protein